MNKKIDYDKIYSSMEGWLAYAFYGDTYNLRKKFIGIFENLFPNYISDVEINRWARFLN